MRKFCMIIIPILIIIVMIFLAIPNETYSATVSTKIGDINGDGKIDSRDTLRILEHVAATTIAKIREKHPDWILSGDKLNSADINGDGKIDSRDTLKELEYIAAATVPKIAQNHPEWKTYVENKWTNEVTDITLNKTSLTIEKGKTVKLEATIKPTDATNKVVTWSSSDIKIATVDGLGNVTGIEKGVAIITAQASNGIYKTCKVTVKEQTTLQTTTKTTPQTTTKNLSGTSVQLNSTKVTYSGKAQTPTVTAKDGSKTLIKGTDYTVTYTNNTNVGTATVTITGKGKYKGQVKRTFRIEKATYKTSTIKFNNSTVTYDGNKHSIIATGLPAGVKATYTGNDKINVGTYTVTAKFTGNTKNYNTIANKRATLKIKPKNITSTRITGIQSKNYTGKAITQNITVKDGSRTLTNGRDYTIKYTNNVKVGTATVTITGKGNYTGKTTKQFKIAKASYNTSSIEFNDSTVTYDGKKHSIKATGIPAGVKVTYTGNNKINAGTYTVTAKFTGNTTTHNAIPTKRATLIITGKPIINTTITGIQNKEYTGKAITQSITVKDENKTLSNGKDYIVSYFNNIKVGTATIMITGKGNYSGAVIKQYSIVEDTKKYERVIAVMRQWKNMNGSKVHEEVYKYFNSTNPKHKMKWDSQWCSETVSAAFVKAGMIDLIGGVASHASGGSQAYETNFKKLGILKNKSTAPKPGWVVCYGGGTAHTALVIENLNGKIRVLAGGNSGSHGVHEKTVSKSSVRFYGAPRFSDSY